MVKLLPAVHAGRQLQNSRSQLDLMLDALEACLCSRLTAEPGNALIDQAFRTEAAVILKAASVIERTHALSRLTRIGSCASLAAINPPFDRTASLSEYGSGQVL